VKRRFLLLCIATQAIACQVPVFRYALERWEADTFRLQLITRGDPPSDLQTIPEYLNLEFETLDLDTLTPVQQLSIVGLEKISEYPSFLLHPPDSWKNPEPLVFQGTSSALQSITDSPLRQRIKTDLLSGHSTVWVLVEGTDQEANEATYQQLQETLKIAQEKISIPDGVIQADQVGKVGDNISLDDVLRSTIPLRISFKIERVLRSNIKEQSFLRILTANRYSPPEEPLVVPIFGRGRTPGPLLGSSITPEDIINACEYLCGACSCQVKSGNPGYDLLLLANWRKNLQNGLVVIDKELPVILPTLNTEIVAESNDSVAPNSFIIEFTPTLVMVTIVGLGLVIGTIVILKKS
jgi:hypothetical protein